MSSDVRDVLNLSVEDRPRPAKRQKTAASRPNLKGLAREVQNLGGDNPIAIVPEISSFKKRRLGSRKPAARWKLAPFRNSARGDGLLLKHWKREADKSSGQDGPANEHEATAEKQSEEIEDSEFAKFNVSVNVPQYSDDQYNATLTNKDWTKDETDYLMETCKKFDLRWPLVWDRYDYALKMLVPSGQGSGEGESDADPNSAVVPTPKIRTMEDLKARYYEVAAKMMAVQRPVQYMNAAEFSLHETMVNFRPGDETKRKAYAQSLLGRSKEEIKEEESLLIEVRRILARTEKFNQERRELYNRLDYPQSETTQDLSSFKTSMGLQNLLQTLMNVDKSKKRKSLAGTEVNTPASAGPSAHPGSTPISDHRRESIAASTHRDSIGESSRPERPAKKGPQQPERRKLTEQEEQIYGVSNHDRLSSGPTFRFERINKILTTKSNAQHQRIINTLAELDVPARLNMPTKAVVDQMEKLLNQIVILLDLKKVGDKLDADIKVEQVKKADREKRNAPAEPEKKGGADEAAKAGAPATESAKADAADGAQQAGQNGDAGVKQEVAEDKMDTT
ncbi:uncharacterized protein BCR38DRAFT_444892 [Pseudomassariella vexata]|uniref:SWR1-complex protein 4 n=1 Tax=Pseudomassariella vexata TaxID=1141098 RepID=A0A1Y2DK11_9PEZI|nr:uncharacterized protein BCR38DRAFT_444892 [Pseudomassariella vexata]ORY59561.1 hypothetical protein BCR38DRAFT_444892 [Pseudomassariella vexata]